MKGKMLSFISNLSPDSDAFAIFVSEKYSYKDKGNILPADTVKKINSFLRVLKSKKKNETINSIDISERQKCLIITVKNKYESYFPQECGGTFFSYLKKFKDIKKIDLYSDTLELEKDKLISFFSEFIFFFYFYLSTFRINKLSKKYGFFETVFSRLKIKMQNLSGRLAK